MHADRSTLLQSLEAPDFSLPDLGERLRTLSEHRGKKVLLRCSGLAGKLWETRMVPERLLHIRHERPPGSSTCCRPLLLPHLKQASKEPRWPHHSAPHVCRGAAVQAQPLLRLLEVAADDVNEVVEVDLCVGIE
jgi:hypothetical protein